MILNLWQWWVDRRSRPYDNRLLALTRILMAVCVLGDLASLAWVGLVPDYFVLHEHGGLSIFAGSGYWFASLGPAVGPVLYGVTAVCMTLVAVGLWVRPATLLGVLAYAQLGALNPAGDRAVDRVIRTALLLLMFSQAHRCYALANRLRGLAPVRETTAWVADVLRWLLVLIYLSAGFAKFGTGGWFMPQGDPHLFRIMTSPLDARLDPDLPIFRRLMPLFHMGGWATMALELGAPVMLTRWAPWWAAVGLVMHLGIAVMMKLGMFSWGMLALYPILFGPWLSGLLDRLEARWAPRPTAAERAG